MGKASPRVRRAADGTSRGRVLEALRSAPAPMTVADLAAAVGLHANTIRFHVGRLLSDGDIELHGRVSSSTGRPRLTYHAVDPGRRVGAQRNYRLLAEILAGFIADTNPDPPKAATRAGEAWGGYLARPPKPHRSSTEREGVDELLRVLAEIGFDPELTDEGREIALHHCPFREVAEAHREVVCAVHLGLMRGVLSAMRVPVTASRLEPFVEPSLCVAYLADAP